ncbi:hypothetical protein SAMN04487848_1766 [Microbacterium sp. ru370.1]|uniref:LapA family protein n=1 Tax=unclassified Microbacterium TaxID=2609290 RepID=UPI000888BA21|nr:MULTISPECIES: LapA family protein [unclassified Microbacterium]SDO62584.1 hypothetical protein SAMN04487848_1766 [Microbacterium sp. ru370.1]SIT86626.1 hypothetical protein SAMN05880579_1764 [Microbacterium sp. RU1D]
MDLRWLDAPATEVAAALAVSGDRPRPSWVPTRRQVLLHVNNALVLWFAFIGLVTIGVQVDGVQDGRVTDRDVIAFVVVLGVLAVWLVGTFFLWRWAQRPVATRTRLRQARRDLTALANGFFPRPSAAATFSSLVTDHSVGVREYPRFATADAEFGTVRTRASRARSWQYVSVRLESAMPHLVLDSRANERGGGLPASIDRGQRLRLEGDFDRFFHTYAPSGYGPDALYVLTPDVMAALVDHSPEFDVEIRDDRVVFFRGADADYTTAADWERVDAVLRHVVPRIAEQSERYVDERVAGQGAVERLARTRDAVQWRPPRPLIAADGRRLDARTPQTGLGPVVGRLAWVTFRAGLYLVPLVFAFAGFMSIVDGR